MSTEQCCLAVPDITSSVISVYTEVPGVDVCPCNAYGYIYTKPFLILSVYNPSKLCLPFNQSKYEIKIHPGLQTLHPCQFFFFKYLSLREQFFRVLNISQT